MSQTETTTVKPEPRTYFVWRATARRPFRTYRATNKRPVPDSVQDKKMVYTGQDYTTAMRVQKAANLYCGRGNAAGQDVLFSDFATKFADPNFAKAEQQAA